MKNIEEWSKDSINLCWTNYSRSCIVNSAFPNADKSTIAQSSAMFCTWPIWRESCTAIMCTSMQSTLEIWLRQISNANGLGSYHSNIDHLVVLYSCLTLEVIRLSKKKYETSTVGLEISFLALKSVHQKLFTRKRLRYFKCYLV